MRNLGLLCLATAWVSVGLSCRRCLAVCGLELCAVVPVDLVLPVPCLQSVPADVLAGPDGNQALI